MFIINDVYNLFWLQTFRLDLGYVVHIVLLAGFQPVKKNNPRGVVFFNSLILREKNNVYDVPFLHKAKPGPTGLTKSMYNKQITAILLHSDSG